MLCSLKLQSPHEPQSAYCHQQRKCGSQYALNSSLAFIVFRYIGESFETQTAGIVLFLTSIPVDWKIGALSAGWKISFKKRDITRSRSGILW